LEREKKKKRSCTRAAREKKKEEKADPRGKKKKETASDPLLNARKEKKEKKGGRREEKREIEAGTVREGGKKGKTQGEKKGKGEANHYFKLEEKKKKILGTNPKEKGRPGGDCPPCRAGGREGGKKKKGSAAKKGEAKGPCPLTEKEKIRNAHQNREKGTTKKRGTD